MNKWTRRGVITTALIGGTALAVGIAIRPGNRSKKLSGFVAEDGETLVNAWVKIDAENVVTAIVPHAEMGQGVHTTLAQMLADELDVDWSAIVVMEAPTVSEYANYPLVKGFLLRETQLPSVIAGTFDGSTLQVSKLLDLQITGGSMSVRATGLHGMRIAGAAAREMIVASAARAWNVPERSLRTERGFVFLPDSEQREPYASFAAQASQMTPPSNPTLKQENEFIYIGKSIPRVDIPAKVNGSAMFSIDAVVPGMKYAAIKHAPVFGSTLSSFDVSNLLKHSGVLEVVDFLDAIAVVADSWWSAQSSLDLIEATWSKTPFDGMNSDEITKNMQSALDEAEAKDAFKKDHVVGNVEDILQSDVRSVSAEYVVPYLAHATMEPMNATCWIHDGVCEMWVGSQNPLGCRRDVSDALGMEAENVQLHNCYLGGGFGRRVSTDSAVECALLAQRTGFPIKLIWSREEDMRHDTYRLASVSRLIAGVGETGYPTAWKNRFVGKHDPKEASRTPYAIENQDIRYIPNSTHVPFGFWRSVDHSQHAFFTESFIDELAVTAKQDPYLYRRRLLGDKPRHREVLDLAAREAGWRNSLRPGRGRGIAIHESFGSIVAQVVQVNVSDESLEIERIVCVVDPGLAVNPDGLVAQMEGGIVFGLSAALYGDISIEKGAVQQSNFHDYEILRIDEMPKIEVHIVNSGNALGGAGEPGTPPIAPALVNAIYDATGSRIRQLPIKDHHIALQSAVRTV